MYITRNYVSYDNKRSEILEISFSIINKEKENSIK